MLLLITKIQCFYKNNQQTQGPKNTHSSTPFKEAKELNELDSLKMGQETKIWEGSAVNTRIYECHEDRNTTAGDTPTKLEREATSVTVRTLSGFLPSENNQHNSIPAVMIVVTAPVLVRKI